MKIHKLLATRSSGGFSGQKMTCHDFPNLDVHRVMARSISNVEFPSVHAFCIILSDWSKKRLLPHDPLSRNNHLHPSRHLSAGGNFRSPIRPATCQSMWQGMFGQSSKSQSFGARVALFLPRAAFPPLSQSELDPIRRSGRACTE